MMKKWFAVVIMIAMTAAFASAHSAVGRLSTSEMALKGGGCEVFCEEDGTECVPSDGSCEPGSACEDCQFSGTGMQCGQPNFCIEGLGSCTHCNNGSPTTCGPEISGTCHIMLPIPIKYCSTVGGMPNGSSCGSVGTCTESGGW